MQRPDASDLIAELESLDTDASHVEKLRLAQAALNFAIGLLETVAEETKNAHAEAYLVDHLKIMATHDHGFLSRDFNLDEWIKALETEDDEGSED